MQRADILALNLTDEEKERVLAAFTAYERFSINNPDYPVPFDDCENEAEVKADIKQRIKQRAQALKSKQKKQASAAEKKAAMMLIQQAVEIAMAKGKTAVEIVAAIAKL